MSAIWPVLHYDDTTAALRYLVEVLGFEQEVAMRDDDGRIVHAELSRAGSGSLVLGSTEHTGGVHGAMRAGTSAVYVETDDVDRIHDSVARADAGTVVQAPATTRFGSGVDTYAFTAADPEGNLWTFGTYRGVSPA